MRPQTPGTPTQPWNDEPSVNSLPHQSSDPQDHPPAMQRRTRSNDHDHDVDNTIFAMTSSCASMVENGPCLLPEDLQHLRYDALHPEYDANRTWSDETLLEVEFCGDTGLQELSAIAKYFSTPRSKDELHAFLHAMQERIPSSCGWIWPLLDQLTAQQGKHVIALLLLCPLREKTVANRDSQPCFTSKFVDGLINSFERCGRTCIALDLRKQCRRDKKDKHCRLPTIYEESLLALATMVEMLIATNVFGIHVDATVCLSPAVCDIIDMLVGPDRTLFGNVYHVPWEPAVLSRVVRQGYIGMAVIRDMLIEYIVPILRDNDTIKLHDRDYFAELCDWYASCGYRSLSSIFVKVNNFTPSASSLVTNLDPSSTLSASPLPPASTSVAPSPAANHDLSLTLSASPNAPVSTSSAPSPVAMSMPPISADSSSTTELSRAELLEELRAIADIMPRSMPSDDPESFAAFERCINSAMRLPGIRYHFVAISPDADLLFGSGMTNEQLIGLEMEKLKARRSSENII